MYITSNGERINLTGSDDKKQPIPEPQPSPQPTPPSTPETKKQSTNLWVIFLIILLVLCLGLWVYNRYFSHNTRHGRHRQF